MAAWDKDVGMQREIHNIQNSPFRTKFEGILDEMTGTAAIGCISDTDPQPILIRSRLGIYAICTIGVINNAEALIANHLHTTGGHFDSMTGGRVNSNELIAAMIDQKKDFAQGIRYAQDRIEGTASILIMKEGGNLIAARDKMGRLPIVIEKNEDGYAVTFEDYAGEKLGYEVVRELGPGEIVEISPEGITQLAEPHKEMKICAFLWSYYGYPTACYEGKNVEVTRYRNGCIMAKADREHGVAQDIDYVAGVPDSGTPTPLATPTKAAFPLPAPLSNTPPPGPAASCPPIRASGTWLPK